MASFLQSQLDFIYFFYGMAFILLGSACLAMARGRLGGTVDLWLFGSFALVHGCAEWLDLAALMLGDNQLFATLRLAVLIASFLFLMEFTRSGATRLGYRVPDIWIYPLIVGLIIGVGVLEGLPAARAVSRYSLGFVGAIGGGLVLAQRARQHSPIKKGLLTLFAIVLALYGGAAGLIVSPAPFWPANVVNTAWFVGLTGIPIQLLRGVLACLLTGLCWAFWGQTLVETVAAARYTAYLRRQLIWTMVALIAILAGGWALTGYLGGLYKQAVEQEARGDAELLVSRLAGEAAVLDAMVKALARSPTLLPMLNGSSTARDRHIDEVLQLDVEAAGALVGMVLNRSGAVIASSDRSEAATLALANESAAPYFQNSIAGLASRRFQLDPITGARSYTSSAPIRDREGNVVGVAMLQKSLEALEASLLSFDKAFYFVDADGVVMLSNRSNRLRQALWPRAVDALRLAAPRSAAKPMVPREIVDSVWTTADGVPSYVLRRPASEGGWSLLMVFPVAGIFPTRFLGIVITLQFSIMALFYFYGREHGIRDSIHAEKRMELQELARGLHVQATTDPLTGLFNRRVFNQGVVEEIVRFDRFQTAFSAVMCDIDYFKEINDVHGHLIGDQVLVHLARILSRSVRQTDFLARWGGEEFVILLVGADEKVAVEFAEKLRNTIAHTAFDEIGCLTCSFGVAECVPGDTPESLLARVDNALYRAKMNGRNRVELASAPLAESPLLAPSA
ncbi:diguanylate cyclase (GGDEF)-like protein [Rhodopseudomonas rhenobacensis]|uniref:diguanylate cyclase n=1 Tax=Rhodopseudomonas rhenobacensis TaxID=87461 RepID=A0A7W7Z5N1_9BRAD|nr:sensor domain-containing diguanylate cyclase [Rhodopseudomonas rhenobacensis]MBB5048210.1 diguanylate cyclase (GGDEF)-like protein [Rhodopseudomonas rhenobacensis]